MKLAQANGVDIDDMYEVDAESLDRSREESLGAQLTAELNMEAEKFGRGHHETINIDD